MSLYLSQPSPLSIAKKGLASILWNNQTDQFCFLPSSHLFSSALPDHRSLHSICRPLYPGDTRPFPRPGRRVVPHKGPRLEVGLVDSLRIEGTRRRCAEAQARRPILARREGPTSRPRLNTVVISRPVLSFDFPITRSSHHSHLLYSFPITTKTTRLESLSFTIINSQVYFFFVIRSLSFASVAKYPSFASIILHRARSVPLVSTPVCRAAHESDESDYIDALHGSRLRVPCGSAACDVNAHQRASHLAQIGTRRGQSHALGVIATVGTAQRSSCRSIVPDHFASSVYAFDYGS